MQAEKAAPSRLHSKVAVGSLVLKLNEALAVFTSPVVAASSVVSGGVTSGVTWKLRVACGAGA